MEKDKKKKSSGKEKSSSSKDKKDSKHEKDDKSKKKSSAKLTSKVKLVDEPIEQPGAPTQIKSEAKIEFIDHDPGNASPGPPTFSVGQPQKRVCVYHNEELKFYNESYQEPVCMQCTIQGPHNSHVSSLHRKWEKLG